jgi:hypothetical protein
MSAIVASVREKLHATHNSYKQCGLSGDTSKPFGQSLVFNPTINNPCHAWLFTGQIPLQIYRCPSQWRVNNSL